MRILIIISFFNEYPKVSVRFAEVPLFELAVIHFALRDVKDCYVLCVKTKLSCQIVHDAM